MKNKRNVFLCYCRDYWWLHTAGPVAIGIMILVLWLDNVAAETIRYVGLLQLVLYLLLAVGGFIYYVYKWNKLQIWSKAPDCRLNEEAFGTMIEQEYRHIIEECIGNNHHVQEEEVKKAEALKDYIMIWTHQIKTPITAMRLILQQEKTEVTEDASTALFEIERYVDSMLQYIRLDQTGADLHLLTGGLEDLVNDAVRYHSRIFLSKKMKLTMGQLDYMVTTDEKWMVFVLKQILSNSLKYTEHGEIHIFAEKAGDEDLVLHIHDTGCGIAPEDLPRIFEKSFTGYNGHLDRKATGIGLFLVKRVLDMLGHEIEITSTQGRGTQVMVRFHQWQ